MPAMNSSESMTTLLGGLAKAKKEGYAINFMMTEHGLCPANGNQYYQPDDLQVDNFYRFEGASDPDENVILYFIRCSDGNKGTLADAYGSYADPQISAFMEKVETIEKKQS